MNIQTDEDTPIVRFFPLPLRLDHLLEPASSEGRPAAFFFFLSPVLEPKTAFYFPGSLKKGLVFLTGFIYIAYTERPS